SQRQLVVPVGISDRREGGLVIDGTLTEWAPEDLIQDGPMVKMFNRPALQRGEVQTGALPAQVYTTWSEDNFYVAFKLTGLSQSPRPVETFGNEPSYSFQ